MRNLYLVRHGKVDFPDNVRRCIGWTDLPLSEEGRRQAADLNNYFQNILKNNVMVFASPLKRAWETARILAGEQTDVCREDGLTELNMGEWENVPMSQLKKTLESEPETGEGRVQGACRIRRTVLRILEETRGDVICVAHAGLNSCLLAELTDTPLETSRVLPQPYGGFSRIQVNSDGTMEVRELGVMPKPAPSKEECQAIWDHYQTPANARLHCEAVCREAERIGEELLKAGRSVDLKVIGSGALLHDVARTKDHHSQEGASIMIREGYPRIAQIVRNHHDLKCPHGNPLSEQEFDRWLEEAVVFLADKRTQQERVVSLEERFAQSQKRCEQMPDREEALAAHDRRYKDAKKIETMIEDILNINGGKGEISPIPICAR